MESSNETLPASFKLAVWVSSEILAMERKWWIRRGYRVFYFAVCDWKYVKLSYAY